MGVTEPQQHRDHPACGRLSRWRFLGRNGDDVLCIKQFKPNKGQDKRWGAPDYVVTQVFDNLAKGRL